MITKYGFEIKDCLVDSNRKRLINQLWKLIPMRENGEDWKKQRSTLIIELAGLNEIFTQCLSYLILLSKLEGLKDETDFCDYRRTIFESISLLGETKNE